MPDIDIDFDDEGRQKVIDYVVDKYGKQQVAQIITRDNGGVRTELGKRSATGTQLFVRNQTDYTRGENLLGIELPTNSIWETLFELEVRQPLMRGRGTQVIFLSTERTWVLTATLPTRLLTTCLSDPNIGCESAPMESMLAMWFGCPIAVPSFHGGVLSIIIIEGTDQVYSSTLYCVDHH